MTPPAAVVAEWLCEAVGGCTANTVEEFFSLLNRGIYCTFHSVSPEHLGRYLDEFAFRYETRKLDEGARIERAVEQAGGWRLVR